MNRLREFRKARGLTLKKVAAALGVTEGMVSYWEADKRKIPADRLESFKMLYKVREDDIYPEVK